MKLVTKNKHKFATGMFWQIPDDGKRSINLSRLSKDTKHNMMCQIKTIKPTWGFCRKEEMQGEKKVAALGKFIIETSKLSASYTNSIICFKFKNSGELGDDGRELDNNLYGYIVLLNGTMCPEEGEYVSNFAMVYESIIQKAKKHEIETLYLPVEVALQLFNIFEVLVDAFHQEALLIKVMNNLEAIQGNILQDFIMQDLCGNKNYLELINNPLSLDLNILRQLIEEPAFHQRLKITKDQTLKYLIPNIFTLAYTSDEIYWKNIQFKNQFNKSLIHAISKQTSHKYKVGILIGLMGAIFYLGSTIIIEKKRELKRSNLTAMVIPKAVAVAPSQLINACLQNNDRFFRDLGIWTFTSLRCNSLGAVLTFHSNTDTTLSRFAALIGKNDRSIKLNARVGSYYLSYKINPTAKINKPKAQILEQLQQAVINYGLKLSLPSSAASTKKINKFTITSRQSPIFLLNHKILDNVKLSDIYMGFDKVTGFYSWTLQGEF